MTDITNSDLTTTDLNGTGVVDVLIKTVKTHLDEQFSESKIRGTEYAQVYLGSIESAISQGIQFLLNKDQAAANADKTREDILLAQAQTDLIRKQIEEISANISLIEANTTNAGKQGLILDREYIKVQSETALLDQNTLNAVTQGANLVKQGDQILSETAKIDSEKELTDQNLTNAITTNTNLIRQQEKLQSETSLITQKKYSEEAQVLDTVNGAAVKGVIGKQKDLYTAQTDGFARDAEQKLAKIFADSWNVRRSTDEGTSAAGTGLTDANIQKVMNKARQGIDAT